MESESFLYAQGIIEIRLHGKHMHNQQNRQYNNKSEGNLLWTKIMGR